jgi:hypothetical protein
VSFRFRPSVKAGTREIIQQLVQDLLRWELSASVTPHRVQARAAWHVRGLSEPPVAQPLIQAGAVLVAGLQVSWHALLVQRIQAVAKQRGANAAAKPVRLDRD